MFCQSLCRQYFHYISKIHDCHFMSTGLNQGNIMADKSDGNIFLFLKLYNQFDDRLLYGHIQSRSCLIQNQNLRFQSKRTGDCHTLTLSAGHIVGITVCEISRQLYHFQKPAAGCILLTFLNPVKVQKGFTYNIPDLHLRVKGRSRVLKYHLNVLAVLTQFLSFELCNILSTVENLSLGRSIQRHQETHEGGFSAAGFSYQSQCLSFIKFQVNIIIGNQSPSVRRWKTSCDMLCLQHNFIMFKHKIPLPSKVLRLTVCGYIHFPSDAEYGHGLPGLRYDHFS